MTRADRPTGVYRKTLVTDFSKYRIISKTNVLVTRAGGAADADDDEAAGAGGVAAAGAAAGGVAADPGDDDDDDDDDDETPTPGAAGAAGASLAAYGGVRATQPLMLPLHVCFCWARPFCSSRLSVPSKASSAQLLP